MIIKVKRVENRISRTFFFFCCLRRHVFSRFYWVVLCSHSINKQHRHFKMNLQIVYSIHWNLRRKYLKEFQFTCRLKIIVKIFSTTFSFFLFQALPKVPVPPLEQTMAEYLRVLQPITTAQQYEKAEKIIKQFLVQPGPKLYQYLVDKREADDNWVRLNWNF